MEVNRVKIITFRWRNLLICDAYRHNIQPVCKTFAFAARVDTCNLRLYLQFFFLINASFYAHLCTYSNFSIIFIVLLWTLVPFHAIESVLCGARLTSRRSIWCFHNSDVCAQAGSHHQCAKLNFCAKVWLVRVNNGSKTRCKCWGKMYEY